MHPILLIDDDEKLAQLLARYFGQHSLLLHHAGAPSIGFNILERETVDLIILDVMLPEMDGFEVCRRLRQTHDIPILMLTARGDVTDRIVGLELGADDYLPKPFEPRELVARIHSILKRTDSRAGPTPDPKSFAFGGLHIDSKKLSASLDEKTLPLSQLEFRLLELFARRVGETLSRDDILNALRGTDADLFTRSVDILVSRLRQKLKPAEPIITVRGAGYCFTGVVQ
ncbi:MAG: response regulator transcription factor [Pseudomonadota bacterium]